ncbi:MAG: ParA family protein [Nitrospirota bacterium]
MGKFIAIANQKGGVGKTTTAINLASSLAVAKKNILLIDIDPQGNATSGLSIKKDRGEGNIYDLFIREKKAADIIQKTELSCLSIIPADVSLVGAEVELIDLSERERILKDALCLIRDFFDYIIIDCPPSLGLLTINALTVADSILIPVQCEYYALEGLGQLLDTVKLVKRRLNPELSIEGLLLTMYDNRNNLCNQIKNDIENHFEDKVFDSIIPRNVTLAEAPSYGKPVLLYNIASKGAQAYLELAKEVIKKCKERH